MHLRTDKMTGLERRKERVRKKVRGTPERPRLNVFRSNKHIYAQVIDDVSARTLAAASTKAVVSHKVVSPPKGGAKAGAKGIPALKKTEAAKKVGTDIACLALAKGVSKVVFDRSGCRYHGRIKALAEAAREAGLKF
ncbi:MAG: 50S ribosomal protein L18 [Deltaproteobacteria bacterium]|nr:50S ribosomal protein L18 [Deltaproteobacteria bacterium]